MFFSSVCFTLGFLRSVSSSSSSMSLSSSSPQQADWSCVNSEHLCLNPIHPPSFTIPLQILSETHIHGVFYCTYRSTLSFRHDPACTYKPHTQTHTHYIPFISPADCHVHQSEVFCKALFLLWFSVHTHTRTDPYTLWHWSRKPGLSSRGGFVVAV